ncbi:MAG: AMP-binding protein [Planctomycetota bacterium]
MHPLLDTFENICNNKPQQPAACDQSLALDYASFQALAGGLAGQIANQTTQPHVGILTPSSTAGAVAIFACWYAGKTPVPLNFLLGPAELAHIIRDAELDLVVTIQHFEPTATAAGLKTILLNSETLLPGACDPPDVAPDDLATLIYTSGTSGKPKGVRLSFDNLLNNVRASITHARIDPTQIFLSVLPQFHSFGFTALTVLPLMLGATVHYLPRFSPAAMTGLIAEKKITILIAIPSMLAAVANMKKITPATFSSLKLTISGGEPLPPRVYDAFRERFGITILEGYGMTESSPIISLNTPWGQRIGSVGQAIPGLTVTAVDETGHELPPGQTGELTVRGHCVMLGYHNQPEVTAATIREGTLYTGDVGHLDEDGYIFITGRAKEMIIVGGENVFPREIEDVLNEHSAVAETAVIGVQDEVRGELPVAFVILKEHAQTTETELRDFCRQRLAGYKVPRRITITTELPRSPTGKILKRALTPGPL